MDMSSLRATDKHHRKAQMGKKLLFLDIEGHLISSNCLAEKRKWSLRHCYLNSKIMRESACLLGFSCLSKKESPVTIFSFQRAGKQDEISQHGFTPLSIGDNYHHYDKRKYFSPSEEFSNLNKLPLERNLLIFLKYLQPVHHGKGFRIEAKHKQKLHHRNEMQVVLVAVKD